MGRGLGSALSLPPHFTLPPLQALTQLSLLCAGSDVHHLNGWPKLHACWSYRENQEPETWFGPEVAQLHSAPYSSFVVLNQALYKLLTHQKAAPHILQLYQTSRGTDDEIPKHASCSSLYICSTLHRLKTLF